MMIEIRFPIVVHSVRRHNVVVEIVEIAIASVPIVPKSEVDDCHHCHVTVVHVDVSDSKHVFLVLRPYSYITSIVVVVDRCVGS